MLLSEEHTAHWRLGLRQRRRRDRRRHPRGLMGGQSVVQIAPFHEASLIDISAGGALVDHMNPVRPGSISFVTLSIHGQKVALKCLVVHSAAHRCEVGSNGERDVIYRTGLEFMGTLEHVPSESWSIHR